MQVASTRPNALLAFLVCHGGNAASGAVVMRTVDRCSVRATQMSRGRQQVTPSSYQHLQTMQVVRLAAGWALLATCKLGFMVCYLGLIKTLRVFT